MSNSFDRPWEAIHIENRNKAFNFNQKPHVRIAPSPVCFKCEKDGRKDTAHWAKDRGVIICPEWLAMNAHTERKKSRTSTMCYWCLYLYKNGQDVTFARCSSHTLYDTRIRRRDVPICEFYLEQKRVEECLMNTPREDDKHAMVKTIVTAKFGIAAFQEWQDDEMDRRTQRMIVEDEDW